MEGGNDIEKGIYFPVLGHSLKPYFGVYAPTRMTHLELFATWLSAYKGSRISAFDVGTGCGILAFMLSRNGFRDIFAGDKNPNALISLRGECARHPQYNIQGVHGDLFCGHTEPLDLVVFNPPWLFGACHNLYEEALSSQMIYLNVFLTLRSHSSIPMAVL